MVFGQCHNELWAGFKVLYLLEHIQSFGHCDLLCLVLFDDFWRRGRLDADNLLRGSALLRPAVDVQAHFWIELDLNRKQHVFAGDLAGAWFDPQMVEADEHPTIVGVAMAAAKRVDLLSEIQLVLKLHTFPVDAVQLK